MKTKAVKIKYPNNIKKFRLNLGLSLNEFALMVDVKNTSTVINWENGKYLPRKTVSLIAMLIIFNTTTDKLYPNYMKKLHKEMNQRVISLKK